jgi:regulator of nonsense transcripts 2
LDSSIKKNTAFVKKLLKLTDETRDPLIKELKTLNLNRYVTEMAQTVASAPLKVLEMLMHCIFIVCIRLTWFFRLFSLLF